MFRYTVICEFTNSNRELAEKWLDWLIKEHIDDVVAAGAQSGEIVQLDGAPLTFEIRYQFESRESFERYELEHAPRLREEGLAKFPLELGLSYRRTTGEIVSSQQVRSFNT